MLKLLHTHLIALLFATSVSVEASTEYPNVLVILVDDLRSMLSSYDVEEMHTPNFDRLAASSVQFDRHYVSVPICIPSRAGLLSGTRSERTRQVYGPFKFNQIEGVRTMGATFSQQGYRSIALGKVWHLPPATRNPDYFDIQEHPYWNRNYAGPNWQHIPKAEQKNNAPASEGPADVPDDAYADGRIALRAVEELRRAAEVEEPFLLLVGFNKPHLPFNAPKQYWDLYDPETLPSIQHRLIAPEGMPDRAQRTQHSLWQYNEGWTFENPPNDEESQFLLHAYAACVSYIDAQIGKVLDAVQTSGAADKTIIVLWSDHGYHLGDLGMWTKHTNFENVASSPLMISAPGFAAGIRSSALVETSDIFPTLLDLCGLPPLEVTDGVSLRPLLEDPQAEWHSAAYHLVDRWEDHGGEWHQHMIGRAVRTDRYRYVEWHKGWERGQPVDRELYDYKIDPLETRNHINDPNNVDLINQLSELLWEWESISFEDQMP